MNLPYCLIINPAAGRGRGRRLLPATLHVLGSAGAEVEVRESTSLADAVAIAREAAAGGKAVVAVGGDGLVGALAGVLAGAAGPGATGPGATGPGTRVGGSGGSAAPGAQQAGVLGIIPAGRGNDFARMLGIPADPARAARILLAGHQRTVDLIGVRAGDGPELAVAGSVYLGIPSEGGEIANGSRWAAGPLGYQIAGLRAVLRWRPAAFTVLAHQGPPAIEPWPGPPDGRRVAARACAGQPGETGIGMAGPESFPGFCVVVANSAYLAAGLRAAPDADISDGLLEVLAVRHSGGAAADGKLPLRSKLPFLRVMRQAAHGAHVRLPDVRMSRAHVVTVTVDRDMLAAADGETLPFASPLPAGSALLIRALPGALRVLSPPAG